MNGTYAFHSFSKVWEGKKRRLRKERGSGWQQKVTVERILNGGADPLALIYTDVAQEMDGVGVLIFTVREGRLLKNLPGHC